MMWLAKNPTPNTGGSTVIAYFDCVANGFEMRGCALALTTKGRRKVWPPKGVGHTGHPGRSVTIVDQTLLTELGKAARSTYRELTSNIERNAACPPKEAAAKGWKRPVSEILDVRIQAAQQRS